MSKARLNKQQRLEIRRSKLISTHAYDLVKIRDAIREVMREELGEGIRYKGDLVNAEYIATRENFADVIMDHNGKILEEGEVFLLNGDIVGARTVTVLNPDRSVFDEQTYDRSEAIYDFLLQLHAANKGSVLKIHRFNGHYHLQVYRKLSVTHDIWCDIGYYDELNKREFASKKPKDVENIQELVAEKLGLENNIDFGLVYNFVETVEF